MGVKHQILLWYVVGLFDGTPLSDHYLCHGFGPETRCDRYDHVCVFDDPRADILCPKTFEMDFEVTEEGSVKTFFYCTPGAWTLTWPDLMITHEQSEACITIDEMIIPLGFTE